MFFSLCYRQLILFKMKVRTIEVAGFKVDVYKFSYASFYYPQFNGNAEFKVNTKGFRELSHYLRTVKYFNEIMSSFNCGNVACMRSVPVLRLRQAYCVLHIVGSWHFINNQHI